MDSPPAAGARAAPVEVEHLVQNVVVKEVPVEVQKIIEVYMMDMYVYVCICEKCCLEGGARRGARDHRGT
jgi:hypothetical protein